MNAADWMRGSGFWRSRIHPLPEHAQLESLHVLWFSTCLSKYVNTCQFLQTGNGRKQEGLGAEEELMITETMGPANGQMNYARSHASEGNEWGRRTVKSLGSGSWTEMEHVKGEMEQVVFKGMTTGTRHLSQLFKSEVWMIVLVWRVTFGKQKWHKWERKKSKKRRGFSKIVL